MKDNPMRIPVPDHIMEIDPYVPGKPIEELEREYGIRDSVKLASNENPMGASPLALAAIGEALGGLHRYPDGGCFTLRAALADHLGVDGEGIVLGNGSDEIIGMLATVLLVPGDRVVMPAPSFLMYDIMARGAGALVDAVPLDESLGIDLEEMARRVDDRTRIVFLCNPNNPTGSFYAHAAFEQFMQRIPDTVVVVVDEAYFEFVRDSRYQTAARLCLRYPNLVVLRTFSKAYGLAGLRVGYGVMHPEMTAVINRIRQPFNASVPAQAGAVAALGDTVFLQRSIAVVHEGIDALFAALDRMGIRYFPTQANFFLVDVGLPAAEVFEAMLKKGVIVRSMASYGYPHYIRINAGLPAENERFLQALGEVLA